MPKAAVLCVLKTQLRKEREGRRGTGFIALRKFCFIAKHELVFLVELKNNWIKGSGHLLPGEKGF